MRHSPPQPPPAQAPTLPILAALAASCATLACAPQPQPQPPPSAPTPPTAHTRPAPEPGTISHISIDAFFPLQQSGDALVFDVRPAIYHQFGHIPGSINWPKNAFQSQLATRESQIRAATAAKRPVIFYCTNRTCPDSDAVARQLAARGHTVTILDGGYEEWKSAGLPTS